MILLDPAKLQQITSGLRPVDAAAKLSDVERQVLSRAKFLPDRERMILELVYLYHLPTRRVGELLGVSAGTVSRSSRQLWRRISQPVATELCRPACPLPATTLAIALDHFLRGRRVKEIARGHGLPLREVRDAIQFVNGWHRGVSQRRA